MPWVDTDWRVQRSLENAAVWVPITVESDQSCFLHAGTLRQAKAYLLREWDTSAWQLVEPVEKLRWRRADTDTYALEVLTSTAPSSDNGDRGEAL